MKYFFASLVLSVVLISGCSHFTSTPQTDYVSSSAGLLAQFLSSSDIRQASAAEQASLNGAVGEKYYWPNNRNNYVISVREAQTNDRLCREYQHVFMYKGQPKTMYDSACQIGGKWGVEAPL